MIVRFGRFRVEYSARGGKRIKGDCLPLKNYKQRDVHSCGFVAALTVVRYLKPEISAVEVLRVVRPSVRWGVNQDNLTSALEKLGVCVDFRDDLTVAKLRKHVEQGIPVIVSVWPDEWINDHWTVVQGFDSDRIYLANHASLSLDVFKRQWSDMDKRGKGKSKEGLVCTLLSNG